MSATDPQAPEGRQRAGSSTAPGLHWGYRHIHAKGAGHPCPTPSRTAWNVARRLRLGRLILLVRLRRLILLGLLSLVLPGFQRHLDADGLAIAVNAQGHCVAHVLVVQVAD